MCSPNLDERIKVKGSERPSTLTAAALFLNCFVNTPMWSMTIFATIFFVCFLNSSIWWVRAASWMYLVVCVLEKPDGTRHQWLFSMQWTERLRKAPWYRWVAKYFPVSLVKTADLPPNRPYLILYHPHGVIGMGVNTALNVDGCGFSELFPGIRHFGVTLNGCFMCPLFREWMLATGYIGPDKSTLAGRLREGESVILLPGGAEEALLAKPKTMRLIRRTGFLRLAKETGAWLVPCIGFGENDAFETVCLPPGSFGWSVQQRLKKMLSFSTPILASPFCKRTPITVVVGAPIDPSGPGSLADNYWKAVADLYHEHRDRHGYSDVPLEFIDKSK